jgi:hypothetical protein
MACGELASDLLTLVTRGGGKKNPWKVAWKNRVLSPSNTVRWKRNNVFLLKNEREKKKSLIYRLYIYYIKVDKIYSQRGRSDLSTILLLSVFKTFE